MWSQGLLVVLNAVVFPALFQGLGNKMSFYLKKIQSRKKIGGLKSCHEEQMRIPETKKNRTEQYTCSVLILHKIIFMRLFKVLYQHCLK
jgi:hypothetical protein